VAWPTTSVEGITREGERDSKRRVVRHSATRTRKCRLNVTGRANIARRATPNLSVLVTQPFGISFWLAALGASSFLGNPHSNRPAEVAVAAADRKSEPAVACGGRIQLSSRECGRQAHRRHRQSLSELRCQCWTDLRDGGAIVKTCGFKIFLAG
jgi:hypothetical protein